MRIRIKLVVLACVAAALAPSVSLATYTLPSSSGRLTRPEASGGPAIAIVPKKKGFRWKPAIRESIQFLVFENGYRLFQKKTREDLSGPFFRDWGRSVKGIHGWGDGDPFITNYIAHPMQGAVSGYFQVQNDPNEKNLEFGRSKKYWISRLKALAWMAAYSTEFEIGPLSEASIGNVGITKGTAGFVDLFVTPAGGFGMMILEDALNRYVLKKLEARNTNRWKIGLYRILFNPSRTFAALMAGKIPFESPSKATRQALVNRPKKQHYNITSPSEKTFGRDEVVWPGDILAKCPSGREICKPRQKPILFDSKVLAPLQFEQAKFPKMSPNLSLSKQQG